MAESSKMSEYELRRKQVLQENKQMFEQLFSDLKPSVARRQSDSSPQQTSRRVTRSRLIPDRSPPRTRSTTNTPDNSQSRQKFNFSLSDVLSRSRCLRDEDSKETINRRRRVSTEALPRRDVDVDISQSEVDLVAVNVKEKHYDSALGTTCHQCRQKTSDTKTVCRNPECVGITGQFCGPCLRNRYGEDAKVVLLDKTWRCPVCRNICNCSICRRRSRKSATGILIHLAREHGHTNVKDFLNSLSK